MSWEIDRDVIRGRDFDYRRTFLPSSLSKVDELEFLGAEERRALSHVQARSYAYILGLLERFIGAKVLQLSGQHRLGNQIALEALVRFADEELKHQELFRRLETMMAARMPPGYRPTADPDAVARLVLGKRTWAVLALVAHVELFVQAHYEQSIAPHEGICPLWRDVLMYHWREECQHAVLDELEWTAEHGRIGAAELDAAVDDFIDLLRELDGFLQVQAEADACYFAARTGRRFTPAEQGLIGATMLKAYRWQYIVSGIEHPPFWMLLSGMTTVMQMGRIDRALRQIVQP